MAASVPTQYPVWLTGADGTSVVVLDLNGYQAAVAAGAAPFSSTVPSTMVQSGGGATVTVAELPLSPDQILPAGVTDGT